MSPFTRFDSKLHVSYSDYASEVLNEDYWVLESELLYYLGHLGSNCIVRVPRGFLSDGASIPWIVRPIFPKMGKYSKASFLHDYLCATYYVLVIVDGKETVYPINRKQVDHIFYEALKVTNVPLWRRVLIRAVVDVYRVFSRKDSPTPNPERERLEREIRDAMECGDFCFTGS